MKIRPLEISFCKILYNYNIWFCVFDACNQKLGPQSVTFMASLNGKSPESSKH